MIEAQKFVDWVKEQDQKLKKEGGLTTKEHEQWFNGAEAAFEFFSRPDIQFASMTSFLGWTVQQVKNRDDAIETLWAYIQAVEQGAYSGNEDKLREDATAILNGATRRLLQGKEDAKHKG